jgi:hypothetical protein
MILHGANKALRYSCSSEKDSKSEETPTQVMALALHFSELYQNDEVRSFGEKCCLHPQIALSPAISSTVHHLKGRVCWGFSGHSTELSGCLPRSMAEGENLTKNLLPGRLSGALPREESLAPVSRLRFSRYIGSRFHPVSGIATTGTHGPACCGAKQTRLLRIAA